MAGIPLGMVFITYVFFYRLNVVHQRRDSAASGGVPRWIGIS